MLRAIVLAVPVLVFAVSVQGEERSWRTTLTLSRTALEQGRSRDAEETATTALRQAEESGADEDDLATIRLVLADACLRQGAYGKAERWAWRAQEPLEHKHGTEHAGVARCVYLRAEVFRRLSLRRPAEPLARQALAIRRKTLGDQHLDIANSLEQLARIWKDPYRSAAGGELYPGVDAGSSTAALQAALTLRKRIQGVEHPDWIAAEIVRLAWLGWSDEWQEQGRRCLDLAIKTQGQSHPLVARCLLVLGLVPSNLGTFSDAQLKEAERRLLEAIALWREMQSPDPADVVPGLRHLAAIRNRQRRYSQAEVLWDEAITRTFANLSDADLCRFFRFTAPPPRTVVSSVGPYERFLTEMIHRGGPAIEACLEEQHRQRYRLYVRQQLYDLFSASLSDLPGPLSLRLPTWEGDLQNLELLTALRRVQGQPDPLRILVNAPARLECEFPDLPFLQVCLKNLDAERRDIDYTAGSDYRSGRQTRWRFAVRDEQGNLLPGRGPLVGEDGFLEGGGALEAPRPHYGQCWETELAMGSFVTLDHPGTYDFHIVYHDQWTIADECGNPWNENLAGLILCRSDPLRLTVKPRRIALERGGRDTVRRLLGALDENGPVKVLGGSYDVGAHKLIPPESPAGRLLTLGWKAVPILLAELERKDLTENRRSWVLAMLFGITGYHDPRSEPGVLGSRESVDRAWGWSNRRLVGRWSEKRARQGKIDPDKQREFARRWQGFEKNLDVTEPEAPK
jgi:tetratricopeptide (TPR) repeat protein